MGWNRLICEKHGRTAYDYALKRGRRDIIKLFDELQNKVPKELPSSPADVESKRFAEEVASVRRGLSKEVVSVNTSQSQCLIDCHHHSQL